MKRSEITKRPLSDKTVSALEAEPKAYRERDGEGLYLYVMPNGKKRWELRYRKPDGKYSWLGMGVYPDVKAKEAREKARDARQLIDKGTTPHQHRKEQEAKEKANSQNTVAALIEEWRQMKSRKITSGTLNKLMLSLNKHVLPEMGNKPINSIQAAYMLEFFRTLEAKGIHSTSEKLRSVLAEAFDLAFFSGRIAANPVKGVNRFIQSARRVSYPHVSQSELPALVRSIDGYPRSPDVRNALLLMVLNGWRPGMVRLLEWADIDFDKGTAFIPAERMKMKVDYHAPLSQMSIDTLKAQYERTGCFTLAFPNRNDPRQPMSNMAMNNALNFLGYKGKQSPHGFRHVLSTGLRERGYPKDQVEAQLAHSEKGVSGIYNKAVYVEPRRKMMEAWALEIQAMVENRENVVAIKGRA